MRINNREAAPTQTRPTAAPPEKGQPVSPEFARRYADMLVKRQAEAQPVEKSEAKPSFFGGLWKKVAGTVSTALTWTKDKVLLPAVKGIAWLGLGVTLDSIKDKRNVYDNPSDVNNPEPGELTAATKAIEADSAKEEAALAKLSPENRKRYESIATQLANRPMSRRALQQMLLDDRLPGAQALKDGGHLLFHLENLLKQPLAKGVDRGQLLGEVISEVENPVRINQQGVGTCGATTAQILLIRKNPTEYVRLIAGLASPKGEVAMAGGGVLNRLSDWDDAGDGGRSMSSRLIQPALMAEASPVPGEAYDNSEDKHKLGPIPLGGGLLGWGESEILAKLTGQDYDNVTLFHWNRESTWNETKQLLADKQGPIPVALAWGKNGSGHFVQLDKIEDGKVYYTNPWGSREWIPEADFKKHVTQVQLPR